MRADQLRRLQEIEEKLTDVLIDEMDPDNWTGATTPISEYTKEIRGDRYWCKKNAAATLTVIMKTHNLMHVVLGKENVPDPDEDGEADTDALIARAEKQAEKIMKQIQDKSKKSDFMKKAHGKR